MPEYAFPMDVEFHNYADGSIATPECQHGMTLRDYFAGQALAFWARADIGGWVGTFPQETANDIARHCYQMADAMLSARERKDGGE